MNANIKILIISLVSVSLIYCSSSPPPKNETQELFDEPDRRIEQQFKALEDALSNLRKECSDLRKYKTNLNNLWQKNKQDEADLLIQLNERQLELYSEWYDSLKKDNLSKQMLYTEKLANSLNEKQKDLWRILFLNQSDYVNWVSDFQKWSKDFENRKNALLNYVRLMGGDSQSNDIFILLIEKDLTY
jgi:hypothetical protein